MTKENRIYIAIDLKSFYASVECMERGLDPLTTNLVVADASKTEKTICLAVSPALKKLGISGRARLYEVVSQVNKANARRKHLISGNEFKDKSYLEADLEKDPYLEIDYIAAPPRMAFYLDYSTKIYNVYLKYAAPEDIHVYSIDEVFIDATNYLTARKMTPKEFAKTIILDVLETTGITATVGIGTNMYLAKIAMDIVAKKIKPDHDGVRIAQVDKYRYRKYLWDHLPLTDFWRIGKGYEKRLNSIGLFTMGDVARCSLGKENEFHNEDLLYKTFGVNAELLIDHAWGYEPTKIADIKKYKPQKHSIGHGQVLLHPYTFDAARTVVKEMVDVLALDLVAKGLLTKQILLTVGYDIENIEKKSSVVKETMKDNYGRLIPKQSRGAIHLTTNTSSAKQITKKVIEWYDKAVNRNLTIRRLNIVAEDVVYEVDFNSDQRQLGLFQDMGLQSEESDLNQEELEKERKLQEVALKIKEKYGKNAILKGINFEKDATTKIRNQTIGGHKA